MKSHYFLRYFLAAAGLMFFSEARAGLMQGALPLSSNSTNLGPQDFLEMYIPMKDCKDDQIQIEFTRFGNDESETASVNCPEIGIQMQDLKLDIPPSDPDTVSAGWQWIPFQFKANVNGNGDLIAQLPDRDPATAEVYHDGIDVQELAYLGDGAILDRRGMMVVKHRWYPYSPELNPKDRVYPLEPNTPVIIHNFKPQQGSTTAKLKASSVKIKAAPQLFNIIGAYKPLGNAEALRILFKYNMLAGSDLAPSPASETPLKIPSVSLKNH